MGREINVEADNRLSLREAVTLNHSYFLMLKAAFEQCLKQVGGAAVMLDSVVEIAAEAGYQGIVDQAASILKVEGGFMVKPSPSGRMTIRRSEFTADSSGENFAHGWSGEVCARVMCPKRCSAPDPTNRSLLRPVHPLTWP